MSLFALSTSPSVSADFAVNATAKTVTTAGADLGKQVTFTGTTTKGSETCATFTYKGGDDQTICVGEVVQADA